MDVRMLLPKNKFDVSGIASLKQLADEQISPVARELLEWVQDINWPVAEPVLLVLAQFYRVIAPEIVSVLDAEQPDCVWKYWIVVRLLPMLPAECAEIVRNEMNRIAERPTNDEILEGVHEEAIKYLAARENYDKRGREK